MDKELKAPFLRTPFNYDRDKASDESALRCLDKTLTQQQFKDECDINVLFARYLDTGEMPQVTQGLTYGDFTGIFDFQTAMNAVRTAEGLFAQFPARIKNRFDNDPQKMLEFLHDENNREEAEFLGLVKKPSAEEITAAVRAAGTLGADGKPIATPPAAPASGDKGDGKPAA